MIKPSASQPATDHAARAREWLALLHSGRATAADRAALATWRRAHPDHDAAYRRSEQVWALLGRVDDVHAETKRRRWPLATAAAIVACVALLAVDAIRPDAERTAAGELRSVQLDDGSRAELAGASAIVERFDDAQRAIELLAGQATFDVVRDTARPFVVQAGAARIRVTGTRFDVKRSGERVLVTVARGSVEVSAGAGQPPHPLRAGEQIAWNGEGFDAPASADLEAALAWQRGRLIFKSRPLAEVAEELQRYRGGTLLVLGEHTRAHRVTGVFATAEPEAALAAIDAALPVTVRSLPGLTLIY